MKMVKNMQENKHTEKIKKLIAEGKITQALKIAEDRDTGLLFELGVSFGEKQNHRIAEVIFDRIIQIRPNDALAWYSKGRALGGLGRHEDAFKCFDQATKINPKYDKAWYNKGAALEKLGEHKNAVECFDQAIKINPNYDNAWYAKGTALTNLGKYQEAFKCFDHAIKINPNFVHAWYNKGTALGNIGKYQQAVKCYDQAININPRHADAWYNKGTALVGLKNYKGALKCIAQAITINRNDAQAWYAKGTVLVRNLRKHASALECFDQAIRVRPNFPEAYANKGITLLDMRRYHEAKAELGKAKELFNKQGLKSDADRAYTVELLAINAARLMQELGPLDTQFLDCLKSGSLTELKEKSFEISARMENLFKMFQKAFIPKDAKELLFSKRICFNVLSKALQFEKVDLRRLQRAKMVFEKWSLETFVTAVNSLDTFVRLLKKHDNLAEVPKEKEEFLMRVLIIAYVFDGKLSEEISNKFRAEPYPAKLTSIEKEPSIQEISVPNIAKDSWIRVCLVQLAFPVSKKFPYQLQGKEKVKDKILKALDIAKREEVNIICFPELSFAEEFVDDVKNYQEMLIIGGSFYDEHCFNVCPVIIGGQDYRVRKIHPSPHFETEIIKGKKMNPGKEIKIFSTMDGKLRFAVLICLDYVEQSYRVCHYGRSREKGVNLIFNPCHNPQPNRCQTVANVNCENYHIDTIQTNLVETGNKYGRSCIIGLEHDDNLSRLLVECVKPSDGIKYKLCEATGESMLIVDLSLKRVEVSTSPDATPRIKIIAQYEYKNERWRK